MSGVSKSANLKFDLDNQSIDSPIENKDVSVQAFFNENDAQGTVTSEEFTFTNASAEQIRQYIISGQNGGVGIYEGMPFDISSVNEDGSEDTFKGFLDLTDGLVDDQENVRVKSKIKNNNGLDGFTTRLTGITYGFLEEQGVFTDADYLKTKYVIQSGASFLDVILISITLYLMIKELQDSIERSANAVAIAGGILASGPFGSIGATIYAITAAIIAVAYSVVMLLAVVELARKLFNILVPPVRTHKAINWRVALSKVCTFLGYTLVSPIEELDNVAYLPSNIRIDEMDKKTGVLKKINGTDKGIPGVYDYGYLCSEMFQLAMDTFNANIAVVGSEVHLRSANDLYWIKTSTYQQPSLRPQPKGYNTKDLVGTRIISFRTDLKDEFTITNYEGTAYEIHTDAKVVNNERAKYISGVDQINLPVCLGNRKDNLIGLDVIILGLAKFVDNLTGILGGGTNLAKGVKAKLGILKMSQNDHSIPKLIYLEGNKLPKNHRFLWSAKVLYNKYHSYKSFVTQNFIGQRTVYTEIEVPFGLSDWISLIDNAYFRNFEGNISKAIDIDWNILSDKAIMSFWVQEPHTKNLIETTIEPK